MKRRLNFLYILLLALAFIIPAGNGFAQDENPVLNVLPLKVAPAEPKKEKESDFYKDIPDEYLEEMQAFFNQCQGSSDMNRYYDCECLSVKLLEQRIEQGDKVDKSSLLQAIAGQCPDATQATGDLYTECLTDPMTPQGMKVEDYCKCYATTYGKLYESSGLPPGTQTFIQLRTQASLTCTNPELARENFPVQPKPRKQKIR